MTDETNVPPAPGTDATQADAQQPGTDTGASATGITAEQGPTDGNGSPVTLTEEALAEGRAK